MATEAPPLAGLRVVEWTASLAGTYAGFLLGGLGADVVRIEPPGAPRVRPRDHVLQRGKRSGDVDCWATCLAGADVALVDEAGPAVASGEGLIVGRVSAWGSAGPPRGLPSEEPLVAALTGVPAMQWSWTRRPVWLVTPMLSYMTGILAALGVVSAVFARRRGAPGQEVAVSGLDASFALNSGTYVTGSETRGSLSQFGDPRGQIPTYSLFRTADGWLFIGALTPTFFVKLMTVLDRAELLADPRLHAPPLALGVPDVKEFVRGEIDPILARRPTAEWVRLLRAADIPCGPVQTRDQALADPEARALGLVVAVDDPELGRTWQPSPPAGFSDTPAPPPRPAPRPAADSATIRTDAASWRRPPAARGGTTTCLEGIRVLDLASFIAGPFCPMLLADLGADVVKIETADGDPFRMAAYGFLGWNRGKRSLVLDLKRNEGREVFLDLARRADVVVDNFRAGVMERLGIGWETLRATNPRLIHTSITGWGPSGPLASLPGFDPIFQARSGLCHAQGGDDDPVLHMIAYTDYCAGALGALATVSALVARERTGRGQRVDVSLFRTGFVAQAAEMIAYPGRPRAAVGGRDYLGPTACRRLYACRDGWLCLVARTVEEATALAGLVGAPVALDEPAEGPAADAVGRRLAGLARVDALGRLASIGVAAAPCLGFEEIFSEPFLRASGCIAEQEHAGLGRVIMGGPMIRFSATPIVYRRAAPLLGVDGAEVLREIDYPAERIAALVEAGVVGRGA